MTTSQLERDFKSQSLHIRFEKLPFETLLAYLSTMGLVLMEAGRFKKLFCCALVGKSLVQGLMKLMAVVH